MRYLLTSLMVLLLTVCVACGSGSSVTPPGGINTPPADSTPDPGTNPTAGEVVLGINVQGDKAVVSQPIITPSNGDESMIDVITFEMTLTELDEITRETSALVNFDREVMLETINATSAFMYERQQSEKVFAEATTYGLPAGKKFPHTFFWGCDANSTGFYRNVQSVTWLGLLTAAELYTLKDGVGNIINDDIQADLEAYWDNTPGSKGFGGWMFDYCMANGDGDDSTKVDRPHSYDVILLSRMANVYNNPKYDFMAQQLMANLIADFPDGADFATYMTGVRKSLSLWDLSGYIWAASLTYEFDWADEILEYLFDNQSAWNGVPYGGFDYTNLGWATIPTALAEMQLYHDATLDADYFFSQGMTNTTGLGFRHSNYGYWGWEDAGRLWDESQISGYALSTMGFTDQYVYNGSDQSVLSAADGCLEWFNMKVLPYSTGLDLDFDGNVDTGAIRTYYRGKLLAGDPFYYEGISEALWGMVVAAEQFSRYPDVPLE